MEYLTVNTLKYYKYIGYLSNKHESIVQFSTLHSLNIKKAIKYNNITVVKYLYEESYYPKVMIYAAKYGRPKIMEYIHSNKPYYMYNYPYLIRYVACTAVYNNHLDIIKYLNMAKIFHLDKFLQVYVGEYSTIDVLKYIHQHVMPITCNMRSGAVCGNLTNVKYMNDISPFEQHDFDGAAIDGHLDILKYLYCAGCYGTIYAMSDTIVEGHLEILKYLHSISHERQILLGGDDHFPDLMRLAVANGHLNIVKYLHESDLVYNKCTLNDMNAAARKGYTKTLLYLYSIGYKCDKSTIDFLIRCRHNVEPFMIKYVETNYD